MAAVTKLANCPSAVVECSQSVGRLGGATLCESELFARSSATTAAIKSGVYSHSAPLCAISVMKIRTVTYRNNDDKNLLLVICRTAVGGVEV